MSNVETTLVQALPPELWNLTTEYAFLDLFATSKGDVSQAPLFLRTGCNAVLARPVLNLQEQQVSYDLLKLFDSRMPHLREIDLSAAEVDGKFRILKSRVRALFPTHPDLNIVTSPLLVRDGRVLPQLERYGRKKTDELTSEKAAIAAAQAATRSSSVFTRVLSRGVEAVRWVIGSSREQRIAALDQRREQINTDLRVLGQDPEKTDSEFSRISGGAIDPIEKGYAFYCSIVKPLLVLLNPQATVEAKAEAKAFYADFRRIAGQMRDVQVDPVFGRQLTLIVEAQGLTDQNAQQQDLLAEMQYFAKKYLEEAKRDGAVLEEHYQRCLRFVNAGTLQDFIHEFGLIDAEFRLGLPRIFGP